MNSLYMHYLGWKQFTMRLWIINKQIFGCKMFPPIRVLQEHGEQRCLLKVDPFLLEELLTHSKKQIRRDGALRVN